MLTILLLAAASSAKTPAPPTDARSLLARVRESYAASPSFTATFVQTYAPAGFADTPPETGRLVLQAPNQIRFDYDGKDGKVFTFDGASARQYVALDKQMIVKPLSPEERSRLPLLFFERPEELLARFEATYRKAENGLHETTLTPRSGGEPKSVTLLTTASGEVKRLVVVDSGGNRSTFTFTQRTPGKARPAPDFALVPPQDTKIVTE